jgi:hypothetical protein
VEVINGCFAQAWTSATAHAVKGLNHGFLEPKGYLRHVLLAQMERKRRHQPVSHLL